MDLVIEYAQAMGVTIEKVSAEAGQHGVQHAGLINRRGLRNPQGTFNLNRWHMPISVAALVWLAIAIVALTLPAPGHNAFYVFVGVAVLGVLWYFLWVRRLPEGQAAVAAGTASPAARPTETGQADGGYPRRRHLQARRRMALLPDGLVMRPITAPEVPMFAVRSSGPSAARASVRRRDQQPARGPRASPHAGRVRRRTS